MSIVQQRRILVAFLAALMYSLNALAIAQDGVSKKADPIDLLSYIAWWSHDDAGYHPAITFKYENLSGEDLTGSELRFQARFTDLRNNYLSVRRNDVKLL